MSENKTNNNQSLVHENRRLTLFSLFEEESLDEILWKVANATDLAVALSDYRGEECTDCINYAEFCRYAREGDDPLCKANNATNAFGIAQAAVQKKPFIYFCPYGLLMFAIPIIVNGEFIGGFVGGQVRCEDAPPETVHLKNVLPYEKDYLQDPLIKEKFMQAKLIPYKKYVNMAALMESYFQQMAEKRSRNISRSQLDSVEKELDAERKKRNLAEKKSSKYKLSSMRTQMNPYFVMSTLTAIANMAIIENAVMTNELINRFAEFMSCLFQKNADIISLKEEAEMIASYLEIYRSWMEDRLAYSIDIDREVRSQSIPAMLVFTLVEQAVYHTVSVPEHMTKIRIQAKPAGDYCEIRIEDNRPKDNPADENRKMIMQQIEAMQGTPVNAGIGIVKERMREYFQSNCELLIEDEGSICCLRYPRRFEKEYI